MPALIKAPFVGRITWLGRVADREAGLTSAPVEKNAPAEMAD